MHVHIVRYATSAGQEWLCCTDFQFVSTSSALVDKLSCLACLQWAVNEDDKFPFLKTKPMKGRSNSSVVCSGYSLFASSHA